MKIDAVIHPGTAEEEKVVIVALADEKAYFVKSNGKVGCIAVYLVKVTDKDYLPLCSGSIGF